MPISYAKTRMDALAIVVERGTGPLGNHTDQLDIIGVRIP